MYCNPMPAANRVSSNVLGDRDGNDRNQNEQDTVAGPVPARCEEPSPLFRKYRAWIVVIVIILAVALVVTITGSSQLSFGRVRGMIDGLPGGAKKQKPLTSLVDFLPLNTRCRKKAT
jgi:hypothetical protein